MAEIEKVNEKKENKNPFINALILLFLLIGLFLIAWFLVPRAIVLLTQATKSSKYSLSNSYIFAAPLSVDADGETKIRVNAFLLNNEGRGVADKQVSLDIAPKAGADGSPQVSSVQPTTDKFGKAVFEVVSSTPGQFVATAVVDGMEIPQTVTLTFR